MINFVVKRSPKAREEIVHIDRLTRYRGTIPLQWLSEIEHDTMPSISDEDDIMNNADKESKSELPDLIVAPEPLDDNTDSGESSLELLNALLVDTQTRTSKSDRGPGLPVSDRATYDELQAVGRQLSCLPCKQQSLQRTTAFIFPISLSAWLR